jgi:hypothetical protein
VELHSRVLTDPSARQDKYYNCGIGTYVPHEDKVSFKYLRQRIHNTIDLAFATRVKLTYCISTNTEIHAEASKTAF